MRHGGDRATLSLVCASIFAVAMPGPVAEAAPARVVALTPFTADVLAGVGIRPVGIGLNLGGQDVVPAALRGVPVLPLSHPNGPNMEQLAQLNPQLVLSAPVWRKGEAAMRRLRIAVAESEPRTVAAVARETRRIGRLVGRRTRADRLADRISRRVSAARRGIHRHPRVLVVLGVGRTSYAFLANSWGGDVVRQAGGRLLTGGLRAPGGYARISDEVVVRRNPDVIIAVPHGSPGNIRKLAAYLGDNPAWRSTRAARRGRIYVSTGNSLLQPRADVAGTIATVRRRFLAT